MHGNTEIFMYYFFSRNSENRLVVDTTLIKAHVVCEVVSDYMYLV